MTGTLGGMRRLLVLLTVIVLLGSACHRMPKYFEDGSWMWDVATHEGGDPNPAHARFFGCLAVPSDLFPPGADRCNVDQDTDFMTGHACMYHPDGTAGCKGLGSPPADTSAPYTAQHWFFGVNGWAAYQTNHPGASTFGVQYQCLNDGFGPVNANPWPC